MRAKGLGEPNRNFWLGVCNGILINGGEAFFHNSVVLAPFFAVLGAPAWAIGLIPAVRIGGWYVPQLLVASRLTHQPFKLPVYRRASTVRVLAYILMTIAVFAFSNAPVAVVAIVLTALGISAVAGGVSGVPFADVTAKVVPHYRLGTFWALRNAIGGGLTLISGWVLTRTLEGPLGFTLRLWGRVRDRDGARGGCLSCLRVRARTRRGHQASRAVADDGGAYSWRVAYR